MLRPWQVTLSERIDPERGTPIYMQIIHALIRDIETGRLTSGTFLPSSRELAGALGVNRKTVVLAYEDLIAQGWLSTEGTRGTMVSRSLPSSPSGEPSVEAGARFDQALYRFAEAPDRPLALPGGKGIKLDEGAPDGRLFPADQLARAYRSAISRASRSNRLQYRDPRGSEGLREQVAEMLRTQRGLPVSMENICITRGSQNGLFLALQVLIEPGDTVIVEELTYEPAVAAIRALGGKVIPVGLDEEGINVAEVEECCRRHAVRAIFLTPHHQFPTTVALRPERRLQLLDLARQFGVAIIEDDYDHEFHFQSQPLLPMAGYAPAQVIYLGSMSKLLLPALRIGYMAAPEKVIDAIAHRVSLTDGMGNTVTEDAAAELIRSGEVRRHARKAWRVYSERRESFARLLHEHLGEHCSFAVPDGGLAFWLRFSGDLDLIEARAREQGLRFASHRSFMARDTAAKGMRLGFASLNEAEAERAIAALAVATRAD
ncbi:PLP-dependent aminotransferase family protein [Novosphingobium pentaromativorans]|uniref:GntR family transcriptional regulator / MocR family aminotransferase n=1 Tax=Novosphingobium pentaromativorans US6-1 TaxID=1088721 RepID=G6EA54_9SPHN|nr:PLP-dependent aminotransferase family protein [Novosphingobium pentaromativorans]AIT80804.1 GntR family transcriptional regulator [Novosphingobium pentaromativorans US6-1]EHJ61911.1 GntR family transcriptional regulator / MocR family aminotransferase [Novosphingobium pentaromativorans US6-1]